VLTTGETGVARRLIFADRWSALPAVVGMPKPIPFLRSRDPIGALQAVFTHDIAVGADRAEGFYGPIQRESGEEFQRNLLGHFFDGGRRSVWTVFIGASEAEDNHEIAKRLRRIKQALDKMFTGEGWLPAGKKGFLSTIMGEQVRFEENVVLAAGELLNEAQRVGKFPAALFVTDGFGPSAALEQVGRLLGDELGLDLVTGATDPLLIDGEAGQDAAPAPLTSEALGSGESPEAGAVSAEAN
jgi:hypothetical protein